MSLNSDNSLSLDNVQGLSDLNNAQAEIIQGGRKRPSLAQTQVRYDEFIARRGLIIRPVRRSIK